MQAGGSAGRLLGFVGAGGDGLRWKDWLKRCVPRLEVAYEEVFRGRATSSIQRLAIAARFRHRVLFDDRNTKRVRNESARVTNLDAEDAFLPGSTRGQTFPARLRSP